MSPKILLYGEPQLPEGHHLKSTYVTFPGTKPVTFRVEGDGSSQAGELHVNGFPMAGNVCIFN